MFRDQKGWLRDYKVILKREKYQKLGFKDEEKGTWGLLAFFPWNILPLR
jgi:hypothetical protein